MATLATLGKPSTMKVLEGNPCPECGFDHGPLPSPRLNDLTAKYSGYDVSSSLDGIAYIGSAQVEPLAEGIRPTRNTLNDVDIIVDEEFNPVNAVPTEDS